MSRRTFKRIFNEQQARKLCKEWQRRLRQEDWRIVVSILRAAEMTNEGAVAECSWTLERKQATINLMDPIDHGTLQLKDEERDMEKDLVHEILHLPFAPFMELRRKRSLTFIAQEQAIDGLADCIVDIYRGII